MYSSELLTSWKPCLSVSWLWSSLTASMATVFSCSLALLSTSAFHLSHSTSISALVASSYSGPESGSGDESWCATPGFWTKPNGWDLEGS